MVWVVTIRTRSTRTRNRSYFDLAVEAEVDVHAVTSFAEYSSERTGGPFQHPAFWVVEKHPGEHPGAGELASQLGHVVREGGRRSGDAVGKGTLEFSRPVNGIPSAGFIPSPCQWPAQ